MQENVKGISRKLLAGAILAAVAFGGSEAFASVSSSQSQNCDLPNWCTAGEQNCHDCCAQPDSGYETGICFNFDPNNQGCICW